jgi:hypothetical protein
MLLIASADDWKLTMMNSDGTLDIAWANGRRYL